MLKRPASSEVETSASKIRVQSALSSLSVYDLHKRLINDYVLCRQGARTLLQRDASQDKRDIDVIRENHRFLWDEDDTPDSWEARLAKKYYDKLFKEYCICDLIRYKENKIAMRWRIEQEVVNGKGQFTCGNKRCSESEGLRTWEVNFAYKEQNEKKNALVKLRLCPECSYKLNYHHKKREVVRSKMKKKNKDAESGPSKRNKDNLEEISENVEDQNQPTVKEETVDDSKEEDDEGKVWREGHTAAEERSRDEEFQEYLEDLFL